MNWAKFHKRGAQRFDNTHFCLFAAFTVILTIARLNQTGYLLRPKYLSELAPASGSAKVGGLFSAQVERFTRPPSRVSRVTVELYGARYLMRPGRSSIDPYAVRAMCIIFVFETSLVIVVLSAELLTRRMSSVTGGGAKGWLEARSTLPHRNSFRKCVQPEFSAKFVRIAHRGFKQLFPVHCALLIR